ncbi:MAG: cell division protein FtsI (penicillin-binding protein 3), partial [Glaciecola sp.]
MTRSSPALTGRTVAGHGTARRRLLTTLLVYGLLFGGVTWRLFDVQVRNADVYADRGASQRERTVTLQPRRGRLYDRDGNVLATSVDASTIYVDPRVFHPSTSNSGLPLPAAADRAVVAEALAPLVGIDVEVLRERFDTDRHFVYVARQLDWELGEKIMALGLPGVGSLAEPRRVYPANGLAGQVIGFTGLDGQGLTGLEMVHNTMLAGEPGTLALERAPGGLSIASAVRQIQPAVPGTDLVLTIDRDIQDSAQRAAADAVEDFNALSATIVVLEIGTGDILAMASAPGYDPNARVDGEEDRWRLKAVTDVFEPGSVQKAVTAAAALEEGIVTRNSIFSVADNIRVGNKTFTDSHDHPTEQMTFNDIIKTSSNVGTIMVAQELGKERLGSYIDRFGFGSLTGLGLPGESPGLVLPTDKWWSTSLPTIAIGQGIAMTLLQAANFYATIGNDGVGVTPR